MTETHQPTKISDAILENVPTEIHTPRLLLRCPKTGDGPEVCTAINETFDDLHKWFGPWAQEPATVEKSEVEVRADLCQFVKREELVFNSYLRNSQSLVGRGGLRRIDWRVRKFMLGWWVRSSLQGNQYGSEAIIALMRLCFETLAANRLEVWVDPQNQRSKHLAEKLGFVFEGELRNYGMDNLGNSRNYLMYSIVPHDWEHTVKQRCENLNHSLTANYAPSMNNALSFHTNV